MAKFRKKPVVVDAIQYPGYTSQEVQDFLGVNLGSEQREGVAATGFFVRTATDNLWLQKNYWIVKDSDGQFQVYAPDIFEKTYDLVEDEKIVWPESATEFTKDKADEVGQMTPEDEKILSEIPSNKLQGIGQMPQLLNFGQAIQALKNGNLVQRIGWNGKGMFIVKQVPSTIGLDIIPKMQSLPQAAKDNLIARGQPISYANQMLIVHPDGRADSWVPSSSDCFAEDWVILE